jgi:hypothetical protein
MGPRLKGRSGALAGTQGRRAVNSKWRLVAQRLGSELTQTRRARQEGVGRLGHFGSQLGHAKGKPGWTDSGFQPMANTEKRNSFLFSKPLYNFKFI